MCACILNTWMCILELYMYLCDKRRSTEECTINRDHWLCLSMHVCVYTFKYTYTYDATMNVYALIKYVCVALKHTEWMCTCELYVIVCVSQLGRHAICHEDDLNSTTLIFIHHHQFVLMTLMQDKMCSKKERYRHVRFHAMTVWW